MRRRSVMARIIGWVIAAAAIASSAADAQINSPTTETRSVKAPRVVTIEGCLQPEERIPDRTPSALERKGILEDYILTKTKVVKGSVPQSATTTRVQDVRYKVIGVSDDELKKHLGKRVQVEGHM